MYRSNCRCCQLHKPRRGGRRIVEDGVEFFVCAECKQKHLEPIAERHRRELDQALHKLFWPVLPTP